MTRPMRQIPLDIRPANAPGFDNFVPGDNAELIAHLRLLTQPGILENLYLWGEEGSGRSHLLQATVEEAHRPIHAVRGAQVGDSLPLPEGGLLVIDDVHRLSPEGQITLFRTINSARLAKLALLLAGDQPPLYLNLREDLRTRIGQALVYRVQALSDQDATETLNRHARTRGLRLEAEVVSYLLRHGRRDLGFLLAVLDQLDERTLVEKRPASITLARQILAEMTAPTSAAPSEPV